MAGSANPANTQSTAATAAPAPAGGGKGGGAVGAPNIYQTASNGLNAAMAGSAGAMGYQPMQVSAPGQVGTPQMAANGMAGAQINGAPTVSAPNAQGQGYAAAQATAQGYNGANVAAPGAVNAQQVQAGQIGNTNLGKYMNPFTGAVIDNSINTLDRTRQMTQGQNGAAATAAGAFGGSRHGLVEAETNRAFADQVGSLTSNLNLQNFQNAQQMAGQDIQTRMQAGLANQGANLQAQTTNAGNQLQAGLANQNSLNTARQFGAAANNQNSQFNAANQTAARQFGALAGNTASLANQQARLAASGQNASNALQGQMANQQSQNMARQFTAGAQNAASAANQNAALQTRTLNAQQQMQAQLANQQAGLQGAGQALGAAGQLGNQANMGFGMGQQVQQQQWQQGQAQQAMQQMLFDAAQGQFGGYTGAPMQSLSAMMAALGGANMGQQTQTTSQKPGLFNYLSLLAGL